ncbi:MAG: YigZ family protein, partial [Clostridia bacterium]|nr:YigZ family protein [Clostridia bacterium]
MNILTIEKDSIFEEAINKSKFIAYSFALKNFEQIEKYLNMLQKEYSDATHICYAYKFLGTEKAVDNGEPQGTAGKPILECIKKQNYSNVLVVVVRYFGGIKLGAGGLTRAYGNSAQKVLTQSGQKQMFECKKVAFKLPITENKKLSFLSNIQDMLILKIVM